MICGGSRSDRLSFGKKRTSKRNVGQKIFRLAIKHRVSEKKDGGWEEKGKGGKKFKGTKSRYGAASQYPGLPSWEKGKKEMRGGQDARDSQASSEKETGHLKICYTGKGEGRFTVQFQKKKNSEASATWSPTNILGSKADHWRGETYYRLWGICTLLEGGSLNTIRERREILTRGGCWNRAFLGAGG